jgi:hypothetical protein
MYAVIIRNLIRHPVTCYKMEDQEVLAWWAMRTNSSAELSCMSWIEHESGRSAYAASQLVHKIRTGKKFAAGHRCMNTFALHGESGRRSSKFSAFIYPPIIQTNTEWTGKQASDGIMIIISRMAAPTWSLSVPAVHWRDQVYGSIRYMCLFMVLHSGQLCQMFVVICWLLFVFFSTLSSTSPNPWTQKFVRAHLTCIQCLFWFAFWKMHCRSLM